MSHPNRDLVLSIIQFLDEQNYKETQHKLERESGVFFNMKYFEGRALDGDWDELEKYLAAFTKVEDNAFSRKIYFEIRKQKYLEALDRHDRGKAVEILMKDLRIFSRFNGELFKDLTQLLTLDNIREYELLSQYGDIESSRRLMFAELKILIEANPLFQEKLNLPSSRGSHLRTSINQRLDGSTTPVSLPVATVAKSSTCVPPGAHAGPFQPTAAPAPNTNALAGWRAKANPSSVPSGAVAASPVPMPPNQVATRTHPQTPSNTLGMMDCQTVEHERLMKRLRTEPTFDEDIYPTHPHQIALLEDIPRHVASTIQQGSMVRSMDFHPCHHKLLAVGCASGEISLWEVGSRQKVASDPFKIWNLAACSEIFLFSLVKDSSMFVRRVVWSPDGNLIGVAYAKHLIHLYSYQGSDLRQHLEIDAHAGRLNDLGFCRPKKEVCVVTCGDDKLIKIWDLSGEKLYTFEGHEAPVYSICPHHRRNIQFLLSTSLDGKIKAWLYDNMGSRFDYDAPGKWGTTMLYSSDGSRLFSCGKSMDGDIFLVEWNERTGVIKRTYSGFRKKFAGEVQFDTTRNRFLAVGEDNRVKFWDMDSTNPLVSVNADGGLPSLPCLRFNKEGNLLAVSTADNGFKILANTVGFRILLESRFSGMFRASTEMKVPTSATATGINPVTGQEHKDTSSPARPTPIPTGVETMPRTVDKPRSLEPREIVDPAECQHVTMPESKESLGKVARLLYTNSGDGILALGSNGVQKIWKWSPSLENLTGKATTSVTPKHWKPKSGRLMKNDVPENSEGAVPCMAMSGNDKYVISAIGGKISLFNMENFKVMAAFMQPPPASTFLALHPLDNNVVAIGREDSNIHIYNARADEVITKLGGHQKHITGLAFSTALKILVSSGADAQLFFWSFESWEKKKSVAIQLPSGQAPSGVTQVQFHTNQIHLLVSHETQLAVYDASEMECVRQWLPQEAMCSSISCAAYSSDSQMVFASFTDGKIGVFDANTMVLGCRIAPSAYMPQPTSNSPPVIPLVITAHPEKPYQLAVGMSDGSVKVIEPMEIGRIIVVGTLISEQRMRAERHEIEREA